MSIFVVETNGRGLAAFSAFDAAEADDTIGADWTRAQLQALMRDGKPAWDGVSELTVRNPDPAEIDAFEKAGGNEVEGGKALFHPLV